MGAHGESSPELDGLIHRVAEKGALARFRVLGFDSPLAARSTVLNQIYMALGVEAIRLGVSHAYGLLTCQGRVQEKRQVTVRRTEPRLLASTYLRTNSL